MHMLHIVNVTVVLLINCLIASVATATVHISYLYTLSIRTVKLPLRIDYKLLSCWFEFK